MNRTAYPYTVPVDQAFMGKERTYSAQTEFRQQAVRLRAIVDNPRNPAEAGAIGRDWAVDDPAAIIEEGSNANGSYTLYAGGKGIIEKLSASKSENAESGIIPAIFPITLPFGILNNCLFIRNLTVNNTMISYISPTSVTSSSLTMEWVERAVAGRVGNRVIDGVVWFSWYIT